MADILSKYGPQPAHALLVRREVRFAEFCREHGFTYAHVVGSLSGRHRPSPELVDALSGFLGVRRERLFTREALGDEFRRGPRTRIFETERPGA